MKLSSKSILSPSRSREASQISLSSSLNRRLRSNGSVKGGQASPMFPTAAKKKGSAFENPEPSSPKVTCIGQVRVKTKKQGKKMRARSKRRVEASFRETDQNFQAAANPDLSRQSSQSFQYRNLQQECLWNRNQRWVHLPFTICEALRAFGAEFNCFFPCRSSCTSSKRDKEEKAAGTEGSGGGHGRESSCGAAFSRWLVALQEGEAKSREIEMVVGEEDRADMLERSKRRHVLEDIDIDVEKKNEFVGEEEEKASVGICIPPKNALLLMRCRSDPVKMAALANRFWESPVPKDEGKEEDNGDGGEEERVHIEEDEEVRRYIEIPTGAKEDSTCEKSVTFVGCEEHKISAAEVEAKPVVEGSEIENRESPALYEVPEVNSGREEVEEEVVRKEDEEEDGGVNATQQDETLLGVSSPEVQVDLEKLEIEEVQSNMLQEGQEKLKEQENDEDDHIAQGSTELASSPAASVASESENNALPPAARMAETSAEGTEQSTEEEEKETKERLWEDEESGTQDRPDSDDPKVPEQKVCPESKERENQSKPKRESSVLPDCLLLMMCEPKLSMEVSKETWVCSTDFIRWLPETAAKKKDGGDEPKKKISIDSKPPPPPLLQLPRSSCSFPAPAAGRSMATMIEQKLVGSSAYEPFVLTRCQSEPMRSSAKFATEAGFWKNRKLEPGAPATLEVGAAGVGF